MNYKELANQNELKSAYLLRGDAFLCGQAKSQLIQKANVVQINVSEFNDENFDTNQIINACNQFSFFDENRVVCVHNKLKELSKAEQKSLQDYINNPNQNCVLIIIDDLNSKAFDFLKGVELVDCKASESYLIDYIKTEFKNNGKQIENVVCKKLSDYCLSDLVRINIEIKKICDYLQNDDQVTSQIIDLLVSQETELQVFALTDALGYKNKDKALYTLKKMLDENEAPIKILGLINGQFRRMMFAKINKGETSQLANALGCKEFAVIKAKEQASKFSAQSLKKILNLLLEADYNIKSGQMSQENSLYYLIMAILNQ